MKEIYCGLLEKLPEDEEIKKRLGVMLVQRSLVALSNCPPNKKVKKQNKNENKKILLKISFTEK